MGLKGHPPGHSSYFRRLTSSSYHYSSSRSKRWLLILLALTSALLFYAHSSSHSTRSRDNSSISSSINDQPSHIDVVEVIPEKKREEDNVREELPLEPRAHALTLKSPRYNVMVLRSILQHSNTSWQTTRHESKGYFIQSLVWMQMIDGLRPVNPGKYMSATCTFPGGYPPRRARIHPFDLHPGDRATGHGFVFYVDCQIPDALQDTKSATAIKEGVTMSFEMNMGTLITPTLHDFQRNLSFIIGNENVPLSITPPMEEKVEFAVCLSPLTFGWQDVPLWSLIEWRMHSAKLGIDRVNWYGRDPTLKRFVDMYQEKQGGKDTFLLVPSLLESTGRSMQMWEIYGDQDAWYMDCIMRNAFSSDFILIIDSDEFIMPDFKLDRPFDQFKDFMRGMGKDVGTIEIDRIAMARPFEKGEPNFYEELNQLQYDCYHRSDMKTVKTLYRAHSVLGVHQHLQRKMYPMPPEIAADVQPKAKENQRYGWHLQHSYDEDVWPKLIHYRWWGDPAKDRCTRTSFMVDMPKYVEYLQELRPQVAKLAQYMDEKYPLDFEPPVFGVAS